jgi:hypothetical protein
MRHTNFPVAGDQDVLHADIAVDHAGGFQDGKFADHCTGDFQDSLGRNTAVMEDKIGQQRSLDPGRGRPKTRAVQAAGIDYSYFAGKAFSKGDQFFEFWQEFALVLVGEYRDADDFTRLPVFRSIDGRIATFLDALTQNVARYVKRFTAPGVNFRRLEMREDAGLAKGINPNRLESRQVAGHAMDGGLNGCEVSLGRQSESREQRCELGRRWFPHGAILAAMGALGRQPALFHERASEGNGNRGEHRLRAA